MNKTSTFLTISNGTASPWMYALTNLGNRMNFPSKLTSVSMASKFSRLGHPERSREKSRSSEHWD